MINEELKAKGETAVSPKGLLEEIAPLLRDYFIGEITLCGDGILYRLPNGQKFIITARGA